MLYAMVVPVFYIMSVQQRHVGMWTESQADSYLYTRKIDNKLKYDSFKFRWIMAPTFITVMISPLFIATNVYKIYLSGKISDSK